MHVETPEQQGQSATLHPQVERTLKIAQQLGAAACAVLPAAQPAQALVRYAREHNLVRVVMGRSTRRWPWQATLAEQIGQSASDLDLLQVIDDEIRSIDDVRTVESFTYFGIHTHRVVWGTR